jgi:transposase
VLHGQLPRHWKQAGLDWGWIVVIWLSYILCAGEQAGDRLYIPVFEQVHLSLGKRGLLWVGDSKMRALATRYQLSLAQAVPVYREEWIVKHGFHRFKGKSLEADPLFVQRDDQVVGLLNLLSLGFRLLTLIQFVVHRQLTQTQNTLTGRYPENPKKSTNRLSTDRLLKVFDQMTLTIFTLEGQSHRHLPPLTPLQTQIIQLLRFSPRIYTD